MKQDDLETYFEKTEQDFRYLMQGAMQYGPEFIEYLAKKALSENKKIVWIEKLTDSQQLGLLDYELQPIYTNKNR